MKGVCICRSINYWITDAEWPDIEGGEEFFTEAYEVIGNVLYSISDICTLVSLTGKVFVVCWGYYWCMLWNLSSIRMSFLGLSETEVSSILQRCARLCVCVCVRLWLFSHMRFTGKSLKNIFIWGDWSLQACKQVFIMLMLTVIGRGYWFNPPTADCPIHPLAICVLCLPDAL